jgi:hypothetical protein
MTATLRTLVLDTTALTIQPISIDDDGVLQSVLTEIDATLGGPTAHINVELQPAADTVIRVIAGLRGDAALYQRYKVLAAVGETDFAVLTRLNRYAPAMWFAAYRDKLEREAPTRAVSEATVVRGGELRDELHRVLGYHLGKHPVEGPRLRAITRGNDYLALANNLRYLAELAIEHGELLTTDRQYEATWVQEALGISTEVRLSLGAKVVPDVRWLDRCAALWTHVQRDYAELANTARFLLRARPDEAKRRFPSLVKGGGRRSDDVEEVPEVDTANDDSDAPANDAEAKADAPPAQDAPTPTADAKPAEPKGPTVVKATKKTAAKKTKKTARG